MTPDFPNVECKVAQSSDKSYGIKSGAWKTSTKKTDAPIKQLVHSMFMSEQRQPRNHRILDLEMILDATKFNLSPLLPLLTDGDSRARNGEGLTQVAELRIEK